MQHLDLSPLLVPKWRNGDGNDDSRYLYRLIYISKRADYSIRQQEERRYRDEKYEVRQRVSIWPLCKRRYGGRGGGGGGACHRAVLAQKEVQTILLCAICEIVHIKSHNYIYSVVYPIPRRTPGPGEIQQE